MVIKVEVEQVEEVVGITFSNEKEADTFEQEYSRRLKAIAKDKGISTDEATQKYQDKITEEMMQEYLQLAKAYERVRKENADVVIVNQL